VSIEFSADLDGVCDFFELDVGDVVFSDDGIDFEVAEGVDEVFRVCKSVLQCFDLLLVCVWHGLCQLFIPRALRTFSSSFRFP
jgi:hypothetical protein